MRSNIVWLFDNDGTLYQVPPLLEITITEKVVSLLMKMLGMSLREVKQKRLQLMNKYQSETTVAAFALAGLIPDFKSFIAQTYLTIDPRKFGLKEDIYLQRMLTSLPGPKYIFTNNPRDFAVLIAQILNINRFFESIYGIEDLGFIGKPNKEAFGKIIKLLPPHEHRIFIDDQEASIKMAKSTGFFTIKIGKMQGEADLNLSSIYELSFEGIEIMTKKQILAEILERLKNLYGIVCSDEEIKPGHMCETIFRARKNNRAVVVKIGLTRQAKKEVLMNKKGYDKIRKIGAVDYLPEPCEFVEIKDIPILIMGDCGENLFSLLQNSDEPNKIFDQLASELAHLYQITRQDDKFQEGEKNLLNAYDVLEEQFKNHLCIYEPFSSNQSSLKSLRQKLLRIPITFGCFACWDFTPEDMFLTPAGLKIIDPPEHLFGLPIVDLACFAGVSRDVYKLPGAEYGYKLLRRLAYETGQLLKLDKQTVNFLFNFGRALQCSLSSRYRINKEVELSKKFFHMAKKFLAKCLNS